MNEPFDKKQDSVYSKRLKAGKRRTYFFDVRSTRGNDYFLTITESRKRMTDDGYDRHKIFLYKEDFHKFIKGLNEAVDFVKTELMPDFDFDAFNHDTVEEGEGTEPMTTQKPVIATDLLSKSAFDGQAQVDGYPLDRIEDLPQVPMDSREGELHESSVEIRDTPAKSYGEEVDRW